MPTGAISWMKNDFAKPLEYSLGLCFFRGDFAFRGFMSVDWGVGGGYGWFCVPKSDKVGV